MIYLAIVCVGLFSSIADRILFKSRLKVHFVTSVYSIVYYCVTVFARVILSSGSDYLSFSFLNKGIRAYIKAIFLMLISYFVFTMVRIVFEGKNDNKRRNQFLFITRFAAMMVLVETMYIVLLGWPNMLRVLCMVLISVCLTVSWCIYERYRHGKGEDCSGPCVDNKIKKTERSKYLCIAIPLFLYILLYVIVGPTELMLYNSGDFVFNYRTALPNLLFGMLLILIPTVILLPTVLPDKVRKAYSCITMFFCLMSYLQSIFLNGKMGLVDGGRQNWDTRESLVNIAIWIAIAFLVLILCRKEKVYRLFLGLSVYIIAIQLITGIYIVIKEDGFHSTTRQLTEDEVLTLSDKNNTVVFILDAYDVQMLQYVIDDDPGYLEPLHDFTYYDNMSSRYTATDGSLPYLLTGADINDPEIEKQQSIWYRDSHFLNDIKNSGYDIRILTEAKYVEEFDDGLIDNYSEDNYCDLDPEKELELFTRCMRYKSLPFLLKPYYRYEEYDITNTITDTNVYVFGTDADFDDKINEYGIQTSDSKGSFRIYHLYGAHSPYYLTADAKLDYDSTPIAQWKGCLKIVYDYIAELQRSDIYDDTTIIIMADHGLNNTQRESVKAAGLSINEDKTNPIFFIKRAEEKSSELRINHKSTSHDAFFDTVRESMNLPSAYYGTVWE